jgi:hypothetical protein
MIHTELLLCSGKRMIERRLRPKDRRYSHAGISTVRAKMLWCAR